ncbi:tetratricopeptide repeat protein [Rhodopirellula sp. P2]|uniref:tetratricopeptide repeat protein n=1 Tax=Rhodopirellula sp. P2 TaxID=2127060 RepID=UPI002368EA65|nr:tetratricopeptide repeat protein [Rhodopirellula sp. P2]WDQ18507.1 tetratricopeptide repeat protein [Rhodopirellula sp. P2]
MFWPPTVIAVLLAVRQLLLDHNGHLEWFGRDDVYAISMFAALPIGFAGARRADKNSRSSAFLLGACLLAGCLCLAVMSQGISLPESLLSITIARALLSCLTAFAVANLCVAIASPQPIPQLEPNAIRAGQGGPQVWPSWAWLLFGTATIAIPATYTHSAAESLEKKLQESLSSNRVALAWKQCWQLRRFDPSVTTADSDLATLEGNLHEQKARLESVVQQPLPRNLTIAMIGRRITTLVQLDRNHEALGWIRPMMSGRHFQAISLDFYGLCQQRLDQPSESLRGYERSLQHWQRQADSPGKLKAMSSAYKGIAFAARQLGNRRLEEEAYQALVQLAPTAEHHFLLATCYKEHQKTSLAAENAQLAAQLDPTYAEQAQSMLAQLSRDHFSCFLVPR